MQSIFVKLENLRLHDQAGVPDRFSILIGETGLLDIDLVRIFALRQLLDDLHQRLGRVDDIRAACRRSGRALT